MPRKKNEVKDEIKNKLEYIGLDLQNIPQTIKKFEPLEFKVSRFYDEKQYNQYRFIPIKDIQILLSPTNRLDPLEEKYKKASPISEYLDSESEENLIKHTTFLNMLKNVKIEEIEKIEEEQKELNKKIPFKVKFEGNYLWQIYYSENTDKYFMLVPTEDSDYSTFFFLLKKQLEKKRTGKIFVPIRNVQYSKEYLKKSEFEDIENYLWLFTKDWPLIYEVYDKNEELSIQIVGETLVYEKIKSPYKIKLDNKIDANKFLKLLKALFILQTEIPQYYKFETCINKDGGIEFKYKENIIKYEDLPKFIKEEYKEMQQKKFEVEENIEKQKERLDVLKQEGVSLDIEYLAKEKQISTYLECKKSFFGKFKYYFKYNKKREKKNIEIKKVESKKDSEPVEKKKIKFEEKKNYTLEELVELGKIFEIQENELKNLLLDINALKLKNKNMKKKIENAESYIKEIDNHKKSIFEFWRYCNKDKLDVLPEGEQEEVNVIKKIKKVFDYEEDIEDFGIKMDKIQRKVLTKEERDSLYITTTPTINLLDKIKNNQVTPKDIENELKEMKKEAKKDSVLNEKNDFDIFGGMIEDHTKIKTIANKKHRELPKNKFNILDINKNTNSIGYKLSLEKIINCINSSIEKVKLPEELSVYKAIEKDKLDEDKINLWNINPENEINEILKSSENKINFYKLNLNKDANIIAYTNIIFYDNQNKTLPLGMNISSKILTDVSKLKIELKSKKEIKILSFDDKTDFSNIKIKNITIWEYDCVEEKND